MPNISKSNAVVIVVIVLVLAAGSVALLRSLAGSTITGEGNLAASAAFAALALSAGAVAFKFG